MVRPLMGVTVLLTALFILWPASVSAGSLPKGDRRLGISVGAAQDGNYAEAFAAAKSAGMQSVTLSLDWSRLEPKPGQYDDTYLTIANSFYPAQNCSVDLILRPINTNHIEMPPDLRGKPFDSPEVIARFDALLDHVFQAIPNVRVDSLAIGNEVDAELGSDDTLWNQYTTFFRAVSAYARRERPGLEVGVVGTFEGLTKTGTARFRALNAGSDVVLVTYYPLNPDFTVESPESPDTDFAALAALYPKRPIVMTEVGLPSSPVCRSSDAAQAEFIRSVFSAWDAHAAQIRAITFSWLTDLSPDAAGGYTQYYGVSGPAFPEFLRTLGLRTYPGAGADKPAFTALKTEAHARGW